MPVPDSVVSEAQEQVFALLEQLPGGESRWDVACRIVALPEIKAAFEARAKLAELQAAPSGSKDLELAEAQAKLEAATAYLREVHEVLSITTNYLLGQGEGEGRDLEECRALATNEALAGFERLDRVLFPKGGV